MSARYKWVDEEYELIISNYSSTFNIVKMDNIRLCYN